MISILKKIASVKVTGWANTRDGALSLNLIHRSFRKLFPNFDLDNESITAEMLIRLTVYHILSTVNLRQSI